MVQKNVQGSIYNFCDGSASGQTWIINMTLLIIIAAFKKYTLQPEYQIIKPFLLSSNLQNVGNVNQLRESVIVFKETGRRNKLQSSRKV